MLLTPKKEEMEEEKQTTKHAYNTEMADLNLSMLKNCIK